MSLLKDISEINKEVLEPLLEKNILKTTDFVSKDVEDIVQLTGIPYKDVVHVRNLILAQCAALPISGRDLYTQSLTSTAILSTGVNSLDELLDGGLYTGEVTELVGEIAAGKTQVCFSASGATAMETNQTVLYIDTGAVFSAKRIAQMLHTDTAKREVLSRICVCRAWTLQDLQDILDRLKVSLRDHSDSFFSRLKLVIVDNVASVVYPILGGGSFAENQGLLSILGHTLKQVAVESSVAVLVTNNVVKGDSNTMVPSLGRLWSHVPHVRVIIRLSEQDSNQGRRTISVLKSSRRAPNTSGSFVIEADGPIS